MSDKYILKGKVPVSCDSIVEWGAFMEQKDVRRVEYTDLGHARVSTVFLGLDHNWSGKPPPILFETLVFDGPMDGDMFRYATWEEAVKGHKIMVAKVKKKGGGECKKSKSLKQKRSMN